MDFTKIRPNTGYRQALENRCFRVFNLLVIISYTAYDYSCDSTCYELACLPGKQTPEFMRVCDLRYVSEWYLMKCE